MQRDFGNRGLGRKTTSNIGESPTCRPGEAYVPMEYCATAPPIHGARPGAVFERLGLSHRHPEILRLAAGIRELAVPPGCLLYTSPSPRDGLLSRMPSSA